MNYVLEGFYKQAEEMGMSREATASFLETIEKTAAALNEYVTDAAMASGNPASFMQKFAAELQDPQLLAQQQAEAVGRPNAQVNPGMLENFIKDNPTIGPYIQKLMAGGKDGAMMGGMGGGVLGLIVALMTGQNPLMGLLAGGGLGALGGGAFGDKLKGLGASNPDEVAKAQATNLSDIQKRDTGNMTAQDADIAKQEADLAAARANKGINKSLDAYGAPSGASDTLSTIRGDIKGQQQAQQQRVNAQPGQPSMQQEIAKAQVGNDIMPYQDALGRPSASINPERFAQQADVAAAKAQQAGASGVANPGISTTEYDARTVLNKKVQDNAAAAEAEKTQAPYRQADATNQANQDAYKAQLNAVGVPFDASKPVPSMPKPPAVVEPVKSVAASGNAAPQVIRGASSFQMPRSGPGADLDTKGSIPASVGAAARTTPVIGGDFTKDTSLKLPTPEAVSSAVQTGSPAMEASIGAISKHVPQNVTNAFSDAFKNLKPLGQ